MYLNKILGIIILVIVFFLLRNTFFKKIKGRNDLLVENIRTFGAGILLLILAVGLFTTKRDFCELFPFFCWQDSYK
jgi:hypothetical protein